MNSFSRNFLEHIGMLGAVTHEMTVPVVPLADLLGRHLPEGQHIDFMNVDVEGCDLQVLQSNDWHTYRPRFVVVEDTDTDPEKSGIVHFMRSCGYEICVQNVIILDKLNEYFFLDTVTPRPVSLP